MTAYSLTTLEDVFEKIPADKIEECMAEIAKGMIYAANLRDVLVACAVAIGASEADAAAMMRLRAPFEWTDDGQGKITIPVFGLDGSKLMQAEYIRKQEDTDRAGSAE